MSSKIRSVTIYIDVKNKDKLLKKCKQIDVRFIDIFRQSFLEFNDKYRYEPERTYLDYE